MQKKLPVMLRNSHCLRSLLTRRSFLTLRFFLFFVTGGGPCEREIDKTRKKGNNGRIRPSRENRKSQHGARKKGDGKAVVKTGTTNYKCIIS